MFRVLHRTCGREREARPLLPIVVAGATEEREKKFEPDTCVSLFRASRSVAVSRGSSPLLSLPRSQRAGSESAFLSLSLSLACRFVASSLRRFYPRQRRSSRISSCITLTDRSVKCERSSSIVVEWRGSLESSSAVQVRVSEMTSSALPPKWFAYLALVLVCQTAPRLIEGHPRAFPAVPPNATSSSAQHTSLSVSRLIEKAYENHELLQPQQWSQRTDDGNDEEIGRTQQVSSSDGMMRYKNRKLLQVPSTTASTHRNSDEKIVFPDGRISSVSPQTALPALACRRSTFCENVAGYPRQLVNAALARNASLRFLETVDPMPDIEQRIDVTDELSLCRFREQVVYPQTAQNKEKQWLFIVNQDDLKQGIRIEVCLNDGQECSLIDGFPEGYKTTCKQKFIYRELAAVGSDGNVVKDQFRFPSSCCCHVKFIGDPSVRLGLGLDLTTNRTQYNRSNAFSTSTML